MTFARTLHAEWIKLRSARSTWYTLGCLVVVTLGITALTSNAAGKVYASATGADRAAWDPTRTGLRAYIVAQLIVGVLAILVVTSEFATGLIGATLAAVPRRPLVLAAKTAVAVAVAAVAGQLLMVSAFLVGQPLMARQGVPHAGLGDPGVLRALFAGGLYLTAIALLAVGLGALIRTTAGALGALIGIVLLVPGLAAAFPSWMHGLLRFWPSLGGAAAVGTVPDPDYPHPWLGLGGMGAGIAVVLVAAFVSFQRRDV